MSYKYGLGQKNYLGLDLWFRDVFESFTSAFSVEDKRAKLLQRTVFRFDQPAKFSQCCRTSISVAI